MIARALLCCWLATCASLAEVASADLLLQDYSAPTHDRFADSSSFIGAAHDWSGVGRGAGGTFWATMISDTYYLSATHHHPSTTVTFFHTNDPTGASETHAVASGSAIAGTDLWLGKLSTAPSAAVKRYPVLDLPASSDYVGLTLFLTGNSSASTPAEANMRVGKNVVEAIVTDLTVGASTGTAGFYDYDDPGGVGASEAKLATGDSGGPSFAVAAGGGLALVGINWFVSTDPEGSGGTHVPTYLTAIDAAMGTESTTTVTAVPEPGSLGLAGLAALLAGLRARRREVRRSA